MHPSIGLCFLALLSPLLSLGQSTDITPMAGELYSWDFQSAHTGYAKTSSGILKTTDKGDTWNMVLPDSGGTEHLLRVEGTDRVLAVVDSGLYRTLDGGQNWKQIGYLPAIDTATQGLRWLQFTSDSSGYAGIWDTYPENVKLHKTTNGGNSWQDLNRSVIHPYTSGPVRYYSPDYTYFLNDSVGLTLDQAGSNRILRTSDGGSSWIVQLADVPPDFVNLREFHELPSGRIYSGTYAYSDDQGKNWTQQLYAPLAPGPVVNSWFSEHESYGSLECYSISYQYFGTLLDVYADSTSGLIYPSYTCFCIGQLRAFTGGLVYSGELDIMFNSHHLIRYEGEILTHRESLRTTSWTVYPLPATDELNFQAEGELILVELELREMNGRILKRWEKREGRTPMDLSDLPNGVYLLSGEREGKRRTIKVVVQR